MTHIDPYKAPQASLETPFAEEYGKLQLFNSATRLNRLRYIAYTHMLILISSVLIFVFAVILSPYLSETKPIFLLIILVVGAMGINFIWVIQRLHDMNLSGWWLVGLLVLSFLLTYFKLEIFNSLLSTVFWVVLTLVPGTATNNQYGNPPPPNTLSVYLAFILPLLLLVAIAGLLVYTGYYHNNLNY
ncbi:DUF805 domain-containing protein [Beggiatoa leptomitoformis]|uniref:DUF805 domain-containing protein n=1 Tax=Beggiatoa leptomitoformis TaxID=288004 RepID=A0A2N9YAE5_9GAMM|nr:DUF805 domain-containing protein [Beggiatoa leptomitoformis]ALG67170.1 DUF805 domain-containing protein [Beggiatoa leptomitoformis]AUI67425.1 DUF805 domain-containing protein [Beggiatoa leptomitoformis]